MPTPLVDAGVRVVTAATHSGTSGIQVIHVAGLETGALYAAYVRGYYNTKTTSWNHAFTPGPAVQQVLITNPVLTLGTKASMDALTSEEGNAYNISYFIAGGSRADAAAFPIWHFDSSDDLTATFKIAVTNFTAPAPAWLYGFRVLVSKDLGVTYNEIDTLLAPFKGDPISATYIQTVPYDALLYVKFQTMLVSSGAEKFTLGKSTFAIELKGKPKPTRNPLAAPVITGVTGLLRWNGSAMVLDASVTLTADPKADSITIQAGTTLGSPTPNVAKVVAVLNNVAQAVVVTIAGLNPTTPIYEFNASSDLSGIHSAWTDVTSFTTSTATQYQPLPFAANNISVAEVIKLEEGENRSYLDVNFSVELAGRAAELSGGNVYLRNRTAAPSTFGWVAGDLNLFKNFDIKQYNVPGRITLGPVVAGIGQQWDVLVLACAKNQPPSEALFTSAQVITKDVLQFANYVPPMPAIPSVVWIDPNTIQITGKYTRTVGTPVPVAILAYTSETSINPLDVKDQVAYFTPDGSSFNYTLTISDASKYATAPGTFLVVLRTLLSNNKQSVDAAKTEVAIVLAGLAAPTLGVPTVAINTIAVDITNATGASQVSSLFTPTLGGSGVRVTVARAVGLRSDVEFQISDSPGGANPLVFQPSSVIKNGTILSCTATALSSSGTKLLKARWSTPAGYSSYSNTQTLVFSGLPLDSTPPGLSATSPRFIEDADGGISLYWLPASLGVSGLGSYLVKRGKTALIADAVIVASPAYNAPNYIIPPSLSANGFLWVDGIPLDKRGDTFYYWLDARNGDGVYSSTPIAFTADGLRAGAVSQNTPLVAPSGVTATVQPNGDVKLAITAAVDKLRASLRVVRLASGAGFTDPGGGVVEGEWLIPGNATSYTDAGLDPTRYYCYRVYSRSISGLDSVGYATTSIATRANNGVLPSNPVLSATTAAGVDFGSTVLQLISPAKGSCFLEILSNTGATFDATTAKRVWSATTPSGNASNLTYIARIPEADPLTPLAQIFNARATDSLGNVSAWALAPPGGITSTAFNILRADVISTNMLQAGSINTEKLTVGLLQRINLVSNGHFGGATSFGDTSNSWVKIGVTAEAQGDTYTTGGTNTTTYNVRQFTAAGIANRVLTQEVPAQGGRFYTVVGLVKSTGTPYLQVWNQGFTFQVSSSTSGAGATVPNFYLPATREAGDAGTAAGSWRLFAYKIMAPAGTTSLQVAIGYTGGVGSVITSPAFVQVYDDDPTTNSQPASLPYTLADGDVSGAYSALQVDKIKRIPVNVTGIAPGNSLVYNGTTFVPGSWGTVTGVTGTAPVVSSGGSAPVISMAAATAAVPGYLTAADWSAFSGKQAALGFTPINKAGDTGVGALGMGALTATTGTFSNAISASNFSGSSSGTNTGDQVTITGNAATATTATNLSGGTVNATTGTFSGAVSASNFSGSHAGTSSGINTGDQTITLTGGVTGSGAGSFVATVITNASLTGDVTSVGNATTLTNAPVIAKVLTGYVSGAGVVAATDSILAAIQKINGNTALKAPLASPAFTGAVVASGITTLAPATATIATIDCSLGNLFLINLPAAGTAVTIGTPTNPSAGQSINILITQGATAATVLTWAANTVIMWVAGNKTISAGLGTKTMVSMTYTGTIWWASMGNGVV